MGQVVIPPLVMREILQTRHNECHWSAEAIVTFLKCSIISTHMLTMAKSVMSKCEICLKNNPVARKHAEMGRVRIGIEPGDYWQVDFIELLRTREMIYKLTGQVGS